MSPMTLITCDEGALARALHIGDSTLILSQRLCEGVAATHSVEEDIAQANIALDLLGQARAWLTCAGDIEGKGWSEDDFAYWREASEFTNLLLVEQENDDFARCIMRQFLFDTWHRLALQKMTNDPHEGLAAIATKAQKEVAYHFRHSAAWLERLGGGTEESHQRLQNALADLWGWCGEFFNGVILSSDAKHQWLAEITPVFARANLIIPSPESFITVCGHSEHLRLLLAEMQSLHRAHPQMQW